MIDTHNTHDQSYTWYHMGAINVIWLVTVQVNRDETAKEILNNDRARGRKVVGVQCDGVHAVCVRRLCGTTAERPNTRYFRYSFMRLEKLQSLLIGNR